MKKLIMDLDTCCVVVNGEGSGARLVGFKPKAELTGLCPWASYFTVTQFPHLYNNPISQGCCQD